MKIIRSNLTLFPDLCCFINSSERKIGVDEEFPQEAQEELRKDITAHLADSLDHPVHPCQSLQDIETKAGQFNLSKVYIQYSHLVVEMNEKNLTKTML